MAKPPILLTSARKLMELPDLPLTTKRWKDPRPTRSDIPIERVINHTTHSGHPVVNVKMAFDGVIEIWDINSYPYAPDTSPRGGY